MHTSLQSPSDLTSNVTAAGAPSLFLRTSLIDPLNRPLSDGCTKHHAPHPSSRIRSTSADGRSLGGFSGFCRQNSSASRNSSPGASFFRPHVRERSGAGVHPGGEADSAGPVSVRLFPKCLLSQSMVQCLEVKMCTLKVWIHRKAHLEDCTGSQCMQSHTPPLQVEQHRE